MEGVLFSLWTQHQHAIFPNCAMPLSITCLPRDTTIRLCGSKYKSNDYTKRKRKRGNQIGAVAGNLLPPMTTSGIVIQTKEQTIGKCSTQFQKFPTLTQDLSRRCIAMGGESMSTYPRRPKEEAFDNAVDVVELL